MISEAKSGYLKRNSNEACKKISISVARFFNQSNLCKGVFYPFLLKKSAILWRGARSAFADWKELRQRKAVASSPPLSSSLRLPKSPAGKGKGVQRGKRIGLQALRVSPFFFDREPRQSRGLSGTIYKKLCKIGLNYVKTEAQRLILPLWLRHSLVQIQLPQPQTLYIVGSNFWTQYIVSFFFGCFSKPTKNSWFWGFFTPIWEFLGNWQGF